MTGRERLHELHLALDGAVDQLAAAHRLAVGGGDATAAWAERAARALAEAAGLRNEVRDFLLKVLGRPT